MTEFRRVDEAPRVEASTLLISWVRLPVLWWRDVPVIEVDRIELSAVDRFMIEAAGRLGHLDAATFQELTGLPELVFTTLGRRLQGLDLLRWEDGGFVPAGTQGQQERTEQALTRRNTATVDFMYLPDTDDLLAVEKGLTDFERAGPQVAGVAPLPTELHQTSVRELLTTRIGERRVANLPPSVAELDPESPMDEHIAEMAGARPRPPVPVCPAIEGWATMLLDGDRPQATLNVGGRAPGNGDPGVPVAALDVSGAAGLVSVWRRMANRPGEPEHRAAAVRSLAPVTLDPEQLQPAGPGAWTLDVTGAQAVGLAERGPLTRPVGLEVRDRHAHVATTVRFTPADQEAERLFALDQLVERLVGEQAAAVDTIDAEPDAVRRVGGRHAVCERAWKLGHRRLVHAIREREDFDYAQG